MIKVAFSGLLMGLLAFSSKETLKLEPIQLLAWQEANVFQITTESDPKVKNIIEDYLQGLSKTGLQRNQQGVWVEDWAILGQNQGDIPVSAASLTKIATSLAVLNKLGVNHRFETKVYSTRMVQNGVLQGNLIIQGDSDPLFVWEEAIALGNTLQDLGIRKVEGNLVIIGDFYMNYHEKIDLSGQLLKQALNQRLWTREAKKQYEKMPPKTPRPEITIAGNIELTNQLPENAKLLIRHQSLTVIQLLKQMNMYSNNFMAETLANKIGGSSVVASTAINLAQIPAQEIQLINGSGLGVENRISPHAICKILTTLGDFLQANGLDLTAILPTAGKDKEGTMKFRNIPFGISIKTGTLNTVSALAGIIPTQERGNVCFAIINSGTKTVQLRQQQDLFLQQLNQHWDIDSIAILSKQYDYGKLGDPTRNFKN